jgi:hypothetical protein
MQGPTHLIAGVLIQKAMGKVRPLLLQYFLVAFLAIISHEILDELARLTYHPSKPLIDDWFWVSYHTILAFLIIFVFAKYWRRYKLGLIFSVLPDLDWVVIHSSELFSFRISFWKRPILHESLFSFLDSLFPFRFLNTLPDLSLERKGVILELAVLVPLIFLVYAMERKKVNKEEERVEENSLVVREVKYGEPEMESGEQNINKNREELEAYNILLKRHINEDRIRAERTSIFLASSSILYLGFISLVTQSKTFLPAVICGFGVLLCFITLYSNIGSWIACSNWTEGQRKIEMIHKNPVFAYMEKIKILPCSQLDPAISHKEKKDWYEKIRYWRSLPVLVPLLFFVLWVVSLLYLISIRLF